jgi:hypothetical protein
MLEAALKGAQARGQSQRDIASQLGYKSSVVLSHMSLGRVPIPVDRAKEMARVLGMNDNAFLLAVLEQRHPDVDFHALFNISYSSATTVGKLEAIAGCSLDDLPGETRTTLEEVVGARGPRRRWLALPELATIELIRDLRPSSATEGMSEPDRRAMTEALSR